MQADLSDLKLDRVDTRSEITHVRFRQTWKGIPVWEGDYLVHLGPDGRIEMANGHYYPFIEAPASPGIGEAAARQTALDDLGGTVSLHGEIDTELVIYPTTRQNEFLLAWRVLVPANAPVGGDWQFFVDAAGGTIVEKVNLATSVTGDGDIIEDHPELTPDPENKAFFRLDGSGFLRGSFVDVHNDVAQRAFSSENSFQFNTGNTHFDEANVYWHIDTYRNDYVETRLGFFSSGPAIETWVHDVTLNANNAGYYPTLQEIRFGNNFEFAKEDKIIYHEFNHLVADVVHGDLQSSPDEQGAISEGTADYFAGSYTERPRIGESVLTDERFIRDMNDPYIGTFAEYQNQPDFPTVEPHDGGELIAAVLWDLWGTIGTFTTDIVTFDALGYLSSNPTFIEFRDAMLESDDFNYGGANNIDIMDTFAARGIGDPAPPISVYLDGPAYISTFGSYEYVTNTAWEDGTVSYQWSILWEQSSTWQNLGTSSTQTVFVNNDYDFIIRVDVQDSENSDFSTRSVDVTF